MAAKSLLQRLLQHKSSSSYTTLYSHFIKPRQNHHTVTNLLWSSLCSTNRYFTSSSDVNDSSDSKHVEVEVEVEERKVKPGVLILGAKEKRELISYAQGLGREIRSQLFGKFGVTDSAVSTLMNNLEAKELVKVKLHKTCPGEFLEVVKQLEEATGSIVIHKIGRTVILYKPSLTKLKADLQSEIALPGEKVKN